jgi:hypothetical protein
MEYMEFVCHAPSDYFHTRNTPYPVKRENHNLCFVWTSLGPEIRTTPSVDEIFGVKDESEDSMGSTVTSTGATTSALAETSGVVSLKSSRDKEKGGKEGERRGVKMEVD